MSRAMPPPLLAYDGRLGALYRLFLGNLLLTMLTLGLYRAWAVARLRRYVWSRMRMQGECFVYAGTGSELFARFLLAAAALLALGAAAGALAGLAARVSRPLAGAVLAAGYAGVLAVTASASFAAQRHHLSRTTWCGVRGALAGSATGYGARAAASGMVAALTLLQFLPWVQLRLIERRIEASAFGAVRFRCRGGRARTIWAGFAASVGLGVLASGLVAALGWLLLVRLLRAGWIAPPLDRHLGILVPLAGGLLGLLAVLLALSGSVYRAALLRHVGERTSLEGHLRFASAATAGGLARLRLGNAAILALTLGFGAPLVLHRDMRFLARTLRAAGKVDRAGLSPSDAC